MISRRLPADPKPDALRKGDGNEMTFLDIPPSLVPLMVGLDRHHLTRLSSKTGCHLTFRPSTCQLQLEAPQEDMLRKAIRWLDQWMTELGTAIQSEYLWIPAAIVNGMLEERREIERLSGATLRLHALDGGNHKLMGILAMTGDGIQRELAGEMVDRRRRSLLQRQGVCWLRVPALSARRVFSPKTVEALEQRTETYLRFYAKKKELEDPDSDKEEAALDPSDFSAMFHLIKDVRQIRDGDVKLLHVRIEGMGRNRQIARWYLDRFLRSALKQQDVGKQVPLLDETVSEPWMQNAYWIFARSYFPEQGVIKVVPALSGLYVFDLLSANGRRNSSQLPQDSGLTANVLLVPPPDKEETDEEKRKKLDLEWHGLMQESRRFVFHLETPGGLVQKLLRRHLLPSLHRLALGRSWTSVKMHWCLGKATFQLADEEYPPTQFKVPDACRPSRGAAMGGFFQDSQFHNELNEEEMELVLNRLHAMGFQANCECEEEWEIDWIPSGDDGLRRYTTVIRTADMNSDTFCLQKTIEKRQEMGAWTWLLPQNYLDGQLQIQAKRELRPRNSPPIIQHLLENLHLSAARPTTSAHYRQLELSYPKAVSLLRHERIRHLQTTEWRHASHSHWKVQVCRSIEQQQGNSIKEARPIYHLTIEDRKLTRWMRDYVGELDIHALQQRMQQMNASGKRMDDDGEELLLEQEKVRSFEKRVTQEVYQFMTWAESLCASLRMECPLPAVRPVVVNDRRSNRSSSTSSSTRSEY